MKKARWLTIALVLLCMGCATVGPDYKRPAVEAPGKWTESTKPAAAALSLEDKAWWKSFGDPVLDSLIEQAVKSNLDLAQARARIVQARSDLVAAGTAALPTVNAKGSVTRSQNSQNDGSLITDPTTVYKMGFDASWEIDVFGGLRRKKEVYQAKLDASVEDLRATLLTLLGDVTQNYVDLRANQEQLDITRRNAQAQRETVAVTRERYRMGLTSYLDAAQAEAQLKLTESNIPTYEIAVKQSIHRLGVLLGRSPDAMKAELSKSSPLPQTWASTETGLPSELLTRRPDLRKAERQLAAASADIGVATADLYPKFDLTAGLGLQSSSTGSLLQASSRYWSIAPVVSLPLFTGGKTRAAIESKKAVYDETLARYRSTFNSALEEVENALISCRAQQERHTVLADSAAAYEDALKLATERYRMGLTNFLDVLEAEKSLYGVQINKSQSKAKLLTSLVSLNKALGGGWKAAGAAETPEEKEKESAKN
ncbi:MAG: Outer membrane protein OprM precursor [Syntrophaceae bacterium PtaU1.Bin231]|jgi:multidrug efflux system outer membrane protein|nr:MAG: Outer membrane protein OprM precursor [Syntrophaceae bacterium PtaU1.Bin231]